MGQALSILISMLKFLAHTFLIPLRLAPSSWTAVTLHFSPALPDSTSSTTISSSDGDSSKINEERDNVPPAVPTLRSLVLDSCPSLLSDSHYRPTPFLASGHLQTIYSARVDTFKEDAVAYKRRVLLLPDGGTLSLDITPPELAEDDLQGNVPTVVCLHGLTGGSGETYVRNCFKPLARSKKDGGKGYRCVVVNFRACECSKSARPCFCIADPVSCTKGADTPVTSPQLYSASKTSDLRCALLFLTSILPNSPMVGIGFSLGANILSKYLGEEGDATPLRGAMVLGTPFDCLRGSAVLEMPGFNRGVYSRAMSGNLNRVIGRAIDVLTLEPAVEKLVQKLLHPPPKAESWRDRQVYPNTLKYVDDTGTRSIGGHQAPYGEFPFDTADEYYVGASSLNVLHNIRRPVLCFNALDDPIVPSELTKPVMTVMGLRDFIAPKIGITVEKKGRGNPNIFLALTPQGGHLGWWTGWRPVRWISKPILEYLSMLAESKECEHLGGKEKHAYSEQGRVVKRSVEVQLLPVDALRKYEDSQASKERQANGEANGHAVSQGDVKAGEEAGPTSQGPGNDHLAWLTTKFLTKAPLVHPFDHAYYRHSTEGEKRKQSMLARGKQLQLEITLDTSRPEVGFVELVPEFRVAGAGDTFFGGKDIPGGSRNLNEAKKADGVIAGL